LNPGPPALDASTLPLGYWGGSKSNYYSFVLFSQRIIYS